MPWHLLLLPCFLFFLLRFSWMFLLRRSCKTLQLHACSFVYYRMENTLMETSVSSSPPASGPPAVAASTTITTVKPKMASGIPPPSPLKILREDSVDGTLSPVSSKSTGTDTDTDTRKKVPFRCTTTVGIFLRFRLLYSVTRQTERTSSPRKFLWQRGLTKKTWKFLTW